VEFDPAAKHVLGVAISSSAGHVFDDPTWNTRARSFVSGNVLNHKINPKDNKIFAARQAHLASVLGDLDPKIVKDTGAKNHPVTQWTGRPPGNRGLDIGASTFGSRLASSVPLIGLLGLGGLANRLLRNPNPIHLDQGVTKVLEDSTTEVTRETVNFMRVPLADIYFSDGSKGTPLVLFETALKMKPGSATPGQHATRAAMVATGLAETPKLAAQLVGNNDGVKAELSELGVNLDRIAQAEKKLLQLAENIRANQSPDGTAIFDAMSDDFTPMEIMVASRTTELAHPGISKMGIRNGILSVSPDRFLDASIAAANKDINSSVPVTTRVMTDLITLGLSRESVTETGDWATLMQVLQGTAKDTPESQKYAAKLVASLGAGNVPESIKKWAQTYIESEVPSRELDKISAEITKFDPEGGHLQEFLKSIEDTVS
jgi:hypothetical protein